MIHARSFFVIIAMTRNTTVTISRITVLTKKVRVAIFIKKMALWWKFSNHAFRQIWSKLQNGNFAKNDDFAKFDKNGKPPNCQKWGFVKNDKIWCQIDNTKMPKSEFFVKIDTLILSNNDNIDSLIVK